MHLQTVVICLNEFGDWWFGYALYKVSARLYFISFYNTYGASGIDRECE